MSTSKIQSGDNVRITTGNYKGIIGQILKVVKIKSSKTIRTRVAVSNVPKIVKYRKSNKSFNVPGQMLNTDRMIDISNVSLITGSNNLSKVSINVDPKTNKKSRILKKDNSVVEKNIIVKSLEKSNNN